MSKTDVIGSGNPGYILMGYSRTESNELVGAQTALGFASCIANHHRNRLSPTGRMFPGAYISIIFSRSWHDLTLHFRSLVGVKAVNDNFIVEHELDDLPDDEDIFDA